MDGAEAGSCGVFLLMVTERREPRILKGVGKDLKAAPMGLKAHLSILLSWGFSHCW